MKILKRIATVLLCLVIFLSTAVCVTAVVLKSTATKSSVIGVSIADQEYCDILYDSVYSALEREMALVVIKPEDISDIVSRDVIENEAPAAAASLIDRLFGKESEEWRFESDELYLRVSELLRNFAAEAEIEYEDGSVDQVYGMICDTVSAEVGVVSQGYVDKISPMAVKLLDVCSLWYVPMILGMLCIAGVLLLGKKHIKNAVYNVILPVFLGMFTVFSVSHILYSKDYLAKTVLGNESLQYFLRQFYMVALYNVRIVSLALSAVLLSMGIVVIVSIALEKKGRHHRHHRHHDQHDRHSHHRHHRHHGQHERRHEHHHEHHHEHSDETEA